MPFDPCLAILINKFRNSSVLTWRYGTCVGTTPGKPSSKEPVSTKIPTRLTSAQCKYISKNVSNCNNQDNEYGFKPEVCSQGIILFNGASMDMSDLTHVWKIPLLYFYIHE